MGVLDPPETNADLLRVCRNIEAEENKEKAEVNKIEVEQQATMDASKTAPSEEAADTADVNAVHSAKSSQKPRSRAPANMECYNCSGFGHYSKECISRPRQQSGRGRGRGSFGGGAQGGSFGGGGPSHQQGAHGGAFRGNQRRQGYSARGAMNTDRPRPHNMWHRQVLLLPVRVDVGGAVPHGLPQVRAGHVQALEVWAQLEVDGNPRGYADSSDLPCVLEVDVGPLLGDGGALGLVECQVCSSGVGQQEEQKIGLHCLERKTTIFRSEFFDFITYILAFVIMNHHLIINCYATRLGFPSRSFFVPFEEVE